MLLLLGLADVLHPECFCLPFCITKIWGHTVAMFVCESQGQEEAAIIHETKNTRPLSKLFTRNNVHAETS